MSFLNKIKLKTGLKQHNRFDLSFQHYTTQDFYKPKVTMIHEMVPTENIEINMSCFTRLEPLQKPLFGHIQIINRCFFVPFRTIMPSWNDFIVGNKHKVTVAQTESFINNVPILYNDSIVNMFIDEGLELVTQANPDSYDFAYPTPTAMEYFNFTDKGKMFNDILLTLGYRWNSHYKPSSTNYSDDTTIFSALPLLAYCKIYYDWFSNPQYANRDSLVNYFLDRGGYTLESDDIYLLLNTCINIVFDNDYFVSAWDKPQSPNGSSLAGFSFPDSSSNVDTGRKAQVSVGNQGSGTSSISETPIISNGANSQGAAVSSLTSFSQLALDTLHRATHYVMRYMASGNRALDRMFAEYGVKLDSEKLNRVDYIGKFDVNIDISDVMQNAPDTASGTSAESYASGVGQFNGKGLGMNGDTLRFSTDEFGYLIVISYPVANPNSNLYVDGRPYMLQHVSKFDFFHGDFDALGTRAIRADELCANLLSVQGQSSYRPNAIFGWTPQYSEYKCNPYNVVSGDYANRRAQRANASNWFLARRFNDSENYHSHDLSFTIAKTKDFVNVFQSMLTSRDHMNTVYNFNVKSWLPMKPMYDIFDFDQEGKDIMMQIGGSKVTD